MAYKDIKKFILNSPAGTDESSDCFKGSKPCKYNKFDQCIVCGGKKGRKQYRQNFPALKFNKKKKKK